MATPLNDELGKSAVGSEGQTPRDAEVSKVGTYSDPVQDMPTETSFGLSSMPQVNSPPPFTLGPAGGRGQ